MKYKIEKDQLFLKVEQNLNLMTARYIEKLAENTGKVFLDLSNARIVDSEGVIMLYRLLKSGKQVYLVNAPMILKEIVQALKLESLIPVDELSVESFEL